MTLERIPEQSPAKQDFPPGISQENLPKPHQLAFHERMEIHELLNFQTVALVKSKFSSGLVFDQDLKALLEKNVQQSMTAVKQLESLYPNNNNGM